MGPSPACLDAGFRLEWSPPARLARRVDCLWADRSPRADPLLPDGAVELVWSAKGLFVRGADTRPHIIGSFPERTFVGVRFRPGGAADVLGLRGHELADARIGISALWGRAEMERLEDLLYAAVSPLAAARVLAEAVTTRATAEPDSLVETLVAALCASRRPLRVATAARWLGVSERQLLRRCTAVLGYGPKTLDRILRFQRFRTLAARAPRQGLAGLAAAVGYADQAHLTRECARLAGETPTALLARL